jgi:6-phosphogluconolactonase (cycloisomerase 2 family)
MKQALAVLIRFAILVVLITFIVGCGGKGSGVLFGPTPTPTPGPGSSFVYTANAGGNSISAFSNDTTGGLTPLAGSPFAFAGGPFGIAATPNGKFLYVSSFQNASVTAFSINATTGALTALTCPAAVTGTQPLRIAITPAGTFLYTSDQQPGGVSEFSIDANSGCLTSLGSIASDAIARDLTIDRTGNFLYVVTSGGGVDTYSIAATGLLTRLATEGFNDNTTTMNSVKASPTADLLLATDSGNTNAVFGLLINTVTGSLAQATAVPQGSGPSAVAFNPAGTFAYVANTTSNSISVNAVTSGGGITPGNPVPDSTGPLALATDKSGQFLYVANNGSSNVSVFKINTDGTLTFVNSFAADSGPEGIAVVAHP